MTCDVHIADDHPCMLGEGPLWHPERRELFWFDILERQLHWLSPARGERGSHSFDRMASAAAWMDERTLLIAFEDGLYRFDLKTAQTQQVASLDTEDGQLRSNDGRCDPWGRFWIGTMGKNAETGRGAIYQVMPEGHVKKIIPHITIPNSIAFTADRRRAYAADSTDERIDRLELDPNSGAIVSRAAFVSLEGTGKVPDGSVVDSEGYLWNAQWDGWCVARYAPDGTLDRTIELPVQRPTCPAFGGPDLRTLYVTSARQDLSEEQLEQQPHAGKLLAVDVDVAGLAEFRFG